MPKLARSDWLRAALECLEAKGIEAVRIVPLARDLGVSRGSFYWHFKDRQDLLDSLLEYWADQMTEAAVRHVESLAVEGEEAILTLFEFIIGADLVRYDSAVRAWALYDKRAGKVLRRVDKRRIGFTTALFSKAGFSPEEAATRGRLLPVYLIGERVTGVAEPASVRRRRMKRRLRLLLANGDS